MGDSYALRLNTTGNLSFFYYNGSTWLNTATTNLNLKDNLWHHVLGQKNNSNLEIYVDGALKSSSPQSGNIAYTLGQGFNVGRHGDGDLIYDFIGVMDEVRIYNRSLSSSEITALYSENISSSSSAPQSSSSSSVSVNKFMIGDRVATNDNNINVRASASLTGTLLGTQPLGSLGYVLSNPISANGYNWYNVNYDNAPDGWSADVYLSKTVQSSSSSAPQSSSSSSATQSSSSSSSVTQSSSSSAPLPTLTTGAKKTLSPVTIDGNLSESVWNLTESITRTISGVNNNTATFSTLWNDQYLYVAVKVLDSVLKNDSVNPWEDDSVEIYIDGNHNHATSYDSNDRQIIKGQGDSTAISFKVATPNLIHGTTNISGGYTMEFAIPWSNLNIAPSANMTIGFDLQQNDDDTGGSVQSAKGWNSTTGTNYLYTSAFGHLVLSATTVGTLPSSSSSQSSTPQSSSSVSRSSSSSVSTASSSSSQSSLTSSSSSVSQSSSESSSVNTGGGTTSGGGGGNTSDGGNTGTIIPANTYTQTTSQTSSTPPIPQIIPRTTLPKTVTGPFSIGIRSNEVKVLQEMLASDPSVYPEGEITGFYGPATTKAVKRFQKKHGIEETGLAGKQTRAKLNEVYNQTQNQSSYIQPQTTTSTFTRELSLGSKGSDVTLLQNRLTSEGVYSGPITGYYGGMTREAVKKYQVKNNLPPVGVVGPKTLQLLNGSSSSTSSSSRNSSLRQLVEFLISLGVIAPDKADLARTSLQAMEGR
jgi:peptidoglycan hydrolase-like protein with peptidoglycan-binding domain